MQSVFPCDATSLSTRAPFSSSETLDFVHALPFNAMSSFPKFWNKQISSRMNYLTLESLCIRNIAYFHPFPGMVLLCLPSTMALLNTATRASGRCILPFTKIQPDIS